MRKIFLSTLLLVAIASPAGARLAEQEPGNDNIATTEIQIATPKSIQSEYRFWIVDNRISTASRYKMGGRVVYDRTIDGDVEAFVSMLCDRRSVEYWRPENSYVIDIARVSIGIRIVELNTINSCGFYAANVPRLVMDLEDYYNAHRT